MRVETDPVTVLGDEERLRELVGNLVQNALRHAASDVLVQVVRRPPDAILVVEDDGPGVPGDALERVFDKISKWVVRLFRFSRRRIGVDID